MKPNGLCTSKRHTNPNSRVQSAQRDPKVPRKLRRYSLGDLRNVSYRHRCYLLCAIICRDRMHLILRQLCRDCSHLLIDIVLASALGEGGKLAFDVRCVLPPQRRRSDLLTVRTMTSRAGRNSAPGIANEDQAKRRIALSQATPPGENLHRRPAATLSASWRNRRPHRPTLVPLGLSRSRSSRPKASCPSDNHRAACKSPPHPFRPRWGSGSTN